MSQDSYNTKSRISTKSGDFSVFSLKKLSENGFSGYSKLPFSVRVLLESLLRNEDDHIVARDHIDHVANWSPNGERLEIPFKPTRVLMQDLTGVPAVVDLVAMRSGAQKLGGDPKRINPVVPTSLVIDHSVQVDYSGTRDALEKNSEMEFERNKERYEFLAWASKEFDNFSVVPPATGIVHQVNLEFLADVVSKKEGVLFPDTLVGTDSHTPMVNALGVLGWGVGGIEAEAVMLGQPVYMLTPDVVGVRFVGYLKEGVTATDLTLHVVEMLRAHGVVGKFVEFFGKSLSKISLADRATISNMAPEYGATVSFFPVDNVTLEYLYQTGRSEELIDMVEKYTKEQGFFREENTPDPEYSECLELDLSSIEPSLAGPKRPQDRIVLANMKRSFNEALTREVCPQGFGLSEEALGEQVDVDIDGERVTLKHGSLVIAAITSCTNTSNPYVMLAAGLLAQKATQKGLQVPQYVKTSMAPGSRVVTDYLEKSGTLSYLEQLGFDVVGYGCTSCIGNSGHLHPSIERAVLDHDLIVSSVLSGNRNFEGRVHPLPKANYLASPPLVIAYAIAGRVDIDLEGEALGKDSEGSPVYLRDIWPSRYEIQQAVSRFVTREQFQERYGNVYDGNDTWNAIKGVQGDLFAWSKDSTYLQEPAFFDGMTFDVSDIEPVRGARVLALLGNSVTTDHISPAGAIPVTSPAAKYLKERGVATKDFNTYGSRRGNHNVMVRGTFGNIRIRNLLVPGSEGGVTMYMNGGEQEEMFIYDATMKYKEEGIPLVVLSGDNYGTGSSRDWAAKGTCLLGVRAVIATGYERIHRSNLIGMGVLPLEFKAGDTWQSLGLTGKELFDIEIPQDLTPGQEIQVRATNNESDEIDFKTVCRIDTPVEVEYYRNSGILHTVLRRLVSKE